MFTQKGERLVSEAVCDVKRLLRVPARRTTSTSFISGGLFHPLIGGELL